MNLNQPPDFLWIYFSNIKHYKMKKLSKTFYLGSILGGFIGGMALLFGVGIGFIFASVDAWKVQDINFAVFIPLVLLMFLGYALFTYGISIFYILLYKAWQPIQDKYVRTTPGKAVGFMFIPFYNFYWVFMAYWGFACDYNKFIQRMGITVPPLNEKMFLAFCILNICSAIPYLGFLAALPALVIMGIVCSNMIDAVNNLHEAEHRLIPT